MNDLSILVITYALLAAVFLSVAYVPYLGSRVAKR